MTPEQIQGGLVLLAFVCFFTAAVLSSLGWTD